MILRGGIDLGGTKCLAVVCDSAGNVLDQRRTDTPEGGDAILDVLTDAGRWLLERGHAPDHLGVGVPGLVDRAGVLRVAPNLPGVVDLAVGPTLSARLDVDVAVDNDANTAAWGEFSVGAAAGMAHMVLITLGTGIGTGLVVSGNLVRGAHGFAGEAGHWVADGRAVVEGTGTPGFENRVGAWEDFTSGGALGRLARRRAEAGRAPGLLAAVDGAVDELSGAHVTEAARAGDPDASDLVDHFCAWLAVGLANLVQLLDPELLVLGGGLVSEFDIFLPRTQPIFDRLVLGADHRPEVPIVPALLGERAGAIGAALLDGSTGHRERR